MTAECQTHPIALTNRFDEIASRFDPPSRALTEMVRHIANSTELDVCSIYVLEPDRRHLCLAATMGLNQSSVRHVRMEICEGLAGLVAEQRMTVCVARASDHPRFKYYPGAGEEKYSTFAGAPIIEEDSLYGVLVTQTIESREFTDTELAQLAVVAEAITPHVSRCRQLEFADTQHESLRN